MSKGKKIMLPGIALALAAIALLSGCITTQASNTPPGGNQGTLPADSGGQGADDGVVKIPVSELSGNARWYEYDAGNTTVRFFAVKDSDGSIKTAFDACDVCYEYKKGYRQEGSYMVCNNCGKRFAISSLGTENRTGGGCWPSYLQNKVVGNEVLISKSDLAGGEVLFR